MKQAAGVVLFRAGADAVELLLVHPSGNYNRRAPWSIPKGLPDADESLEEAARRECQEEAGVAVGALSPLGSIDYTKSRKRVHAFVAEAARDAQPSPACWEIDRAEFVPLDEARRRIHRDQAALIDMLEAWLARREQS